MEVPALCALQVESNEQLEYALRNLTAPYCSYANRAEYTFRVSLPKLNKSDNVVSFFSKNIHTWVHHEALDWTFPPTKVQEQIKYSLSVTSTEQRHYCSPRVLQLNIWNHLKFFFTVSTYIVRDQRKPQKQILPISVPLKQFRVGVLNISLDKWVFRVSSIFYCTFSHNHVIPRKLHDSTIPRKLVLMKGYNWLM